MKVNTSRSIIGDFYKMLPSAVKTMWVFMVSHYNGNSNQDSETYVSSGLTPQFQLWRGARDRKDINFDELIIRNEKYEATLGDTVDNFRYDKTGQLQNRISGFARRAVTHWHKLFTELIEAGGATAGIDGSNFYSTSHRDGQTNDLSASDNAVFNVATPTDPTAAEFANIINYMISRALSFTDDVGEPLNEDCSRFHIMVPPNMGAVANTVATKSTIQGSGGAIDNPIIDAPFTFVPHVNARRAWTSTDIHIFCEDAPTKSVILQERGGVSMSAKAEGSDFEHDNDEWEFGAKSNRGVGLLDWENSVRGTLS